MNKISAIIALLLFVPAFSIGVTMSLFIVPGKVGNGIFTVMKVWAIILPLLWTIKTNPRALSLPKFKWREIKFGLGLGILMFSAIALAYLVVGQQVIDQAEIRSKAQAVGLVNPYVYLAGCFYWSLINSFIEECTWRGFVVSQCQVLLPQVTAVIVAALFFTAHHSIALYGYTKNWIVVLLGSLGVFLAGVIWAWCFSRYQSLIPSYLSHILADIAIAIIGWQLLFI